MSIYSLLLCAIIVTCQAHEVSRKRLQNEISALRDSNYNKEAYFDKRIERNIGRARGNDRADIERSRRNYDSFIRRSDFYRRPSIGRSGHRPESQQRYVSRRDMALENYGQENYINPSNQESRNLGYETNMFDVDRYNDGGDLYYSQSQEGVELENNEQLAQLEQVPSPSSSNEFGGENYSDGNGEADYSDRSFAEPFSNYDMAISTINYSENGIVDSYDALNDKFAAPDEPDSFVVPASGYDEDDENDSYDNGQSNDANTPNIDYNALYDIFGSPSDGATEDVVETGTSDYGSSEIINSSKVADNRGYYPSSDYSTYSSSSMCGFCKQLPMMIQNCQKCRYRDTINYHPNICTHKSCHTKHITNHCAYGGIGGHCMHKIKPMQVVQHIPIPHYGFTPHHETHVSHHEIVPHHEIIPHHTSITHSITNPYDSGESDEFSSDYYHPASTITHTPHVYHHQSRPIVNNYYESDEIIHHEPAPFTTVKHTSYGHGHCKGCCNCCCCCDKKHHGMHHNYNPYEHHRFAADDDNKEMENNNDEQHYSEENHENTEMRHNIKIENNENHHYNKMDEWHHLQGMDHNYNEEAGFAFGGSGEIDGAASGSLDALGHGSAWGGLLAGGAGHLSGSGGAGFGLSSSASGGINVRGSLSSAASGGFKLEGGGSSSDIGGIRFGDINPIMRRRLSGR